MSRLSPPRKISQTPAFDTSAFCHIIVLLLRTMRWKLSFLLDCSGPPGQEKFFFLCLWSLLILYSIIYSIMYIFIIILSPSLGPFKAMDSSFWMRSAWRIDSSCSSYLIKYRFYLLLVTVNNFQFMFFHDLLLKLQKQIWWKLVIPGLVISMRLWYKLLDVNSCIGIVRKVWYCLKSARHFSG